MPSIAIPGPRRPIVEEHNAYRITGCAMIRITPERLRTPGSFRNLNDVLPASATSARMACILG